MELINNKYKLLNKLGSGSFGVIYKGKNIRTNELVAIKMELIDKGFKLLKNESIVYSYLKGCKGIPEIKWFGKDKTNYYMVISLLGMSLEELKYKIPLFSLPLVLKIGSKIMIILKTIHDKGLIHRDVKPENFMFGKDGFKHLYLIDFGFCKSYLNNENGKHNEMKNTNNIIGSLNYSSIHSHMRKELSRRDDIESAMYVLLYLWNNLPWNNDLDENLIFQKKRDILNNLNIPSVFKEVLSYIRDLDYKECPDYYFILKLFENNIKTF